MGFMLQLLDWNTDGPTMWGDYCRGSLGTCTDDKCSRWDGNFDNLQPPWFSTCGIHTLTSVVHLLFLVVWLLGVLWTFIGLLNSRPENYRVLQNRKKLHTPGLRGLLAWSISCCFILSLQNVALAVYGVIQALHGADWPVHAEVCEVIQSVAWALLGLMTHSTWNQKEERFSASVRTWWTAGFCLSFYTLVCNFLLSGSWDLRIVLVEAAMFPFCTFLFILAVRGKTGIVEDDEDDPKKEFLIQEEEDVSTGNEAEVTPYATAGYFSLATVSWISPLLAKGAEKPLEYKDVPLPAPGDRSSYHFSRFKSNWEKQVVDSPTNPPSFYRALLHTFWKGGLWNAFFAGITSVAAYVGPFLIEDFVEYLAGRRRFSHEGAFLVFCFSLSKAVEILAQRQWYMGMQWLGLHVKSALTGFVYQKGLILSNNARQHHTSGEIINYVSVDVERIGDFSWYLQEIWTIPLQIFLALLVLYKVVGIAALSALVASILVVLLNMPLAKLQDKYQDKLMEAKDLRMKSLTESLRSMRILKLQAWESRYLSKVESLRDVECGWLKRTLYSNSAVVFVFWTAPIFVSVATFGTCALIGVPLTSGRLLTALAVFITMTDPLSLVAELISMLSQTKVSIGRVQKYLIEEELQVDAVTHVQPAADEGIAVEVKGGEFKWNPTSEQPTLLDINFRAFKGQRVAICGTVGAGKSSLLSCLLGEIPKIAGTVTISGGTAYVPQTAWIQSGKVEDNILFGRPMDRKRYQETLKLCSLEKDMELLAFGDQTEIGERGINLSGGQKQRIQLARAVYQNADVYLLDDPFSAVDAHTGSDLFTGCILGLLSEKTVLYVTHQVEFLSAADLILVLRGGKIVQCGTHDELLQSGADFSALVHAHNEAIGFMTASGYNQEVGKSIVETEINVAAGQLAGSQSLQLTRKDSIKEVVPAFEQKQLVEDEEVATGHISSSVYITYFTSVCRGALIPLIFLSQVIFQVLQIASNYWMAWSTPATAGAVSEVNNTTLILVYCAFAFGSCVFVSIRAVLVSTFGYMAASKFFKDMLRSIFRAPMSFFDSTPNGRILSRASSDQDMLDNRIMFTVTGTMLSLIQVVGILAIMSQVTWLVLVILIPVALASIWLQRYYVKTARELQRMTGVVKAPIIHHYAESIAGAATIRGFQQEMRFLERNFVVYDHYTRAVFHNFASIQWLMFRLEFLSSVVFTFCLIYVVAFPVGAMDPGMAGLAVSWGLQLNTVLAWGVWNYSYLGNRMISVERIKQFSNLEKEAPYVIEECRPPADWPSEGVIEFRNLQVRYNDHSPLVLHGLTCRIPGGKKVGVVGRTGSGKSTLIQALFRLVEPAGGSILIDGVDICSIGLHDLRSKLSVIPQDPTLFEGTMRFNLDPLEQYSDAEIWEALDKCQLGDIVRSKDLKLDLPVSENGENWSVGQRQLVCLGRALLKRTRILVLDEATASVDSTTDAVIQRTIRSEFEHCTVITVAHRIPTVVDSDRVLVLSDGKVAEDEVPTKLLKDKSSFFYKLVSEYSTRSSSKADLRKLKD